MQDTDHPTSTPLKRTPWNKGKLIGPKPPLRSKHVWSIRTRLQVDGRTRELAMFNLAIDSKLRGCDVVALKVEDVAPRGYAIDLATVRQEKTGRPVKFELTDQTREAVDNYPKVAGKKPGQFCSKGAADRLATSRRASTRDCFQVGSQALDSIPNCSARIRVGAQRPL
jgi:integrase